MVPGRGTRVTWTQGRGPDSRDLDVGQGGRQQGPGCGEPGQGGVLDSKYLEGRDLDTGLEAGQPIPGHRGTWAQGRDMDMGEDLDSRELGVWGDLDIGEWTWIEGTWTQDLDEGGDMGPGDLDMGKDVGSRDLGTGEGTWMQRT